MSYKSKVVPVSIFSYFSIAREAWDSIMTIDNSPIRHIKRLDPMAAHAIFQILAYMWSAIFALYIGSIYAFGISGAFHSLLIGGIFITAASYKQAEKRSLNPRDGYNGRMAGGEHE